MANTYHQIHIQTIFAPKYRSAVLAEAWQPEIFGVIGNLVHEAGCKTIIVNGVEDHVHCFVSIKPTVCISDLMKIVKAKSSKYINDNHLTKGKFEWQDGYGAFSYCHSHLKEVYEYIARQHEHHKKQNFRDEYRALLNEFEVPFEEQYIFEDLI